MPHVLSSSQEETTSQFWDVIVVGAGPAGSLAARQLAFQGLSVLLVDRAEFPRWKVCGCCLTAQSQNLLDQVGLGHLLVEKHAISLKNIRLASGKHRADLPLPGWVSLSRESLDSALVQKAVDSGVAFLPGTQASLGRVTPEFRQLNLVRPGHSFATQAKLVLAADGLGGKLWASETNQKELPEKGSRIGAGVVVDRAPEFFERGSIYMACGQEGYVGLVRLEDGRLDLATALDREEVKRRGGPGAVAVHILKNTNWPVIPDLLDQKWRGTAPLTRQTSVLGGNRVLVLGDAAGYVEPFTGEGITWALTSAILVTPLAKQAVHSWRPTLAEQWTQLHRKTMASRQLVCRLIARSLRYPSIVRAALSVLARFPQISGPVVRQLGNT